MLRKHGMRDSDPLFEGFCERLADRVYNFAAMAVEIEEKATHWDRISIDDLIALAGSETRVRECLRSESLERIARASARVQAGGPFDADYQIGHVFASVFSQTAATRTMFARAMVDVRKELTEARALEAYLQRETVWPDRGVSES